MTCSQSVEKFSNRILADMERSFTAASLGLDSHSRYAFRCLVPQPLMYFGHL